MAGKIRSRRSCYYVPVATLIAVLALCVLEVLVLSTSRPRAAILSGMTGMRYLLLPTCIIGVTGPLGLREPFCKLCAYSSRGMVRSCLVMRALSPTSDAGRRRPLLREAVAGQSCMELSITVCLEIG